jgi:pimeloyl-ACP methyl ester carboxylesterase
MRQKSILLVFGMIIGAITIAAGAAPPPGQEEPLVKIEKKTCPAPDGVKIVYSAAGKGEPALVFIHGGLANRRFYDGQLRAFADRYRVIALDLPGHGESGANRKTWGFPEFGADVAAVCGAEKLNKIILIGNSLGGPVAIEAALLLPGKALGVIGVDTFQSLDYSMTPEQARQRALAFRDDYAGATKEMVKSLFHKDADPELVADAERRMSKTSPEAAYQMFLSMGGYNQADSARKLTVPLRAVNGDLYPTDFRAVRKIKPDFDAVIMMHTGHYPMLERPEEFNRNLVEFIVRLAN